MPPRFAYWTVILDGVPTSFRAHDQAELLPTFNQLKRKNPGALMKWFSGGKLWDSPEQAREERQKDRTRQFRDVRDQERKAMREPQEGGMRTPFGGPRPQLEGNDPATVALRKRIADRAAQGSQVAGAPRGPQESPDAPAPDAPAPDTLTAPPVAKETDEPVAAAAPPARESRPRAPKRDDRRPKAWRPGGEHRDPRDKYKLPPGEGRKRWKERNLGPKSGKPFGAGPGGRPPGAGFSKPPGPGGGGFGGDRPPRKDFSRPPSSGGGFGGPRPPGKGFSKPPGAGGGGYGGDRPPRKDFSRPPSSGGGFGGPRPPGKGFSKPPGSGGGGYGGDRPPRKDFSRPPSSGGGFGGPRPPGKGFSKPPGAGGGGYGGDRPPRKDFSRPPSSGGGFGGPRPPGKGGGVGKSGGFGGQGPRGKEGFRGPGKGTSRPPGRGRR